MTTTTTSTNPTTTSTPSTAVARSLPGAELSRHVSLAETFSQARARARVLPSAGRRPPVAAGQPVGRSRVADRGLERMLCLVRRAFRRSVAQGLVCAGHQVLDHQASTSLRARPSRGRASLGG
jgi:hypothetical protein